ncbi:MAG TPA: PH domain-containing protein [Candidatus Nanoarchaeia archaeon]|nr:PH domain-containing protein [Candidatus Nanoarchaeia archaeon]
MTAKPTASKSFPGQHEGEEVELVFHQHPLVMRKQLIIGMLAILIGLLPILQWPLSDFFTRLGFIYIPLAVAVYWFYRWIGWYYSVYIVTNERLVEIKQKGFFNRRVTEFGLDKIQNINYHINGFQAVLFQFGDIAVQTYVGDLVMKTIHKPVAIQEQLVEIVRRVNGPNVPPPPRQE